MGLLLVFYSCVLGRHLCAVAGGADSSGYINCAMRIHDGRLIERIKALEIFKLEDKYAPAFIPLGFTWRARGKAQVPLYYPGLPLHMVVLAGAAGWKIGPFLVSPLAALLGLLLMYLLARQFGLSRPYSLGATILLAAYPFYLYIAVQPMSDVLATLWVMAAILAAMRSRKKKGWAVLGGAAFGMSILVRPTNALVLFPLLFALPWNGTVYLLFALAGLPFAIFMGLYNGVLFGNPLTTGYGGDFGKDFVWTHLRSRFSYYSHWLSTTLTPAVPLAWLVLPADKKEPIKDRLLLFFWFAPFLLLFCAYEFYQSQWFVRYLLPGLPAVILAALLLLRDGRDALERKIRGAGFWARSLKMVPFLLVGVVFIAEIRQIGRLGVWENEKYEAVYKDSCLSARQMLPAQSVIMSMQLSGAITYYTNFIPCRWDILDPALFWRLRRRVESRGYHWYALLFPFEERQFQDKVPGSWERIQKTGQVSLWRLTPKHGTRTRKAAGKKFRNKSSNADSPGQDLADARERPESGDRQGSIKSQSAP